MTAQAWRDREPADGDIQWRAVRADGAVIAGLVDLGRSTVVYTYDPRLTPLDGARFSSFEAAQAAIDAAIDWALAAPAPKPAWPQRAPAAGQPRTLHHRRRAAAEASYFTG